MTVSEPRKPGTRTATCTVSEARPPRLATAYTSASRGPRVNVASPASGSRVSKDQVSPGARWRTSTEPAPGAVTVNRTEPPRSTTRAEASSSIGAAMAAHAPAGSKSRLAGARSGREAPSSSTPAPSTAAPRSAVRRSWCRSGSSAAGPAEASLPASTASACARSSALVPAAGAARSPVSCPRRAAPAPSSRRAIPEGLRAGPRRRVACTTPATRPSAPSQARKTQAPSRITPSRNAHAAAPRASIRRRKRS